MSFSNNRDIDCGAFAYFSAYIDIILAQYKPKNTPATPTIADKTSVRRLLSSTTNAFVFSIHFCKP